METHDGQLSAAEVRKLKVKFREQFDLPLEICGTNAEPVPCGREASVRQPLCALVCKDEQGLAQCIDEHKQAIQTAVSTGQPHTFVCHAGLIVTCTPVKKDGKSIGAFLSGKMLPGKNRRKALNEIARRLNGYPLSPRRIEAAMGAHPVPSREVIDQSSDCLTRLADEMSKCKGACGCSGGCAAKLRGKADEMKAATIFKSNPSEKVRAVEGIVAKAREGRRSEVRHELNAAFQSFLGDKNATLTATKARVIEFVASITRAAADASIDVDAFQQKGVEHASKTVSCQTHSELRSLATAICSELLEALCVRRTRRTQMRIENVVKFLEQNYARNITVEELAEQAGLSPSRLAHLFQEKLNTTMIATLTKIRIEHAKNLLVNSPLSCTEIAFKVGFNDQSYFTRVFHKQEKMTPRQYRVQNRPADAPAPNPESVLIETPAEKTDAIASGI